METKHRESSKMNASWEFLQDLFIKAYYFYCRYYHTVIDDCRLHSDIFVQRYFLVRIQPAGEPAGLPLQMRVDSIRPNP